MRYVELQIRPEGRRWFHPVDEHVANDPNLRHGPIHNFNLLDDGTVVLLYEIYGPKDRIDELLEEHGTGLKRDTTKVSENTLVWAHLDPSEVVGDLLELTDHYSIVVDTPIHFTDDHKLELVLVGEPAVIREMFEDAPDTAQVTVEKTGDYQPKTERLFTNLTARQQEVLIAALKAGYYDDPRNATYDDIADAVGCSATTVGEHLRKIERRIIREIAPVNA
ncbi:MAG: putative DNA binding protein [Natronomonas sp.]|jgi:predicted DNA binding protein